MELISLLNNPWKMQRISSTGMHSTFALFKMDGLEILRGVVGLFLSGIPGKVNSGLSPQPPCLEILCNWSMSISIEN